MLLACNGTPTRMCHYFESYAFPSLSTSNCKPLEMDTPWNDPVHQYGLVGRSKVEVVVVDGGRASKKKESINLKLKTTIRNQHNKFSIHDWCGAVVHEDTSSVYLWMWMPLSPMDQSKNCMWDQVTIFDTCAHAELVGILFRDVLRFRDFSRKKVMDWCPACETARCFTNWNRPDLEASSKRQITEVLTNHVMED